jgi:hypothetical protein
MLSLLDGKTSGSWEDWIKSFFQAASIPGNQVRKSHSFMRINRPSIQLHQGEAHYPHKKVHEPRSGDFHILKIQNPPCLVCHEFLQSYHQTIRVSWRNLRTTKSSRTEQIHQEQLLQVLWRDGKRRMDQNEYLLSITQ